MSAEPLGIVSPLMPGQGQPIQVGIVSNQTSPFHILGDIQKFLEAVHAQIAASFVILIAVGG